MIDWYEPLNDNRDVWRHMVTYGGAKKKKIHT